MNSLVEAINNQDLLQIKKIEITADDLSMLFEYEGKYITPLVMAVLKNDVNICSYLIEKGADVNARDKTGRTPLHCAAEYNQLETGRILLSNKADIHAHIKGWTALHSAVYRNQLEMTKFLIQHNANVETKAKGRTALNIAVTENNLEMVKLLIENGASMESKTNGYTALNFTVTESKLEMSKFLIENGANKEAKTNGATALHIAITNEDLETVKCLLDHGADPNKQIIYTSGKTKWKGGTALHLAVSNEHSQIVALLLNYKVDINAVDNQLETALDHAYKVDLVEMLLAYGANPYHINASGQTYIDKILGSGHVDIMRSMYERGFLEFKNRIEEANRFVEAFKEENKKRKQENILKKDDLPSLGIEVMVTKLMTNIVEVVKLKSGQLFTSISKLQFLYLKDEEEQGLWHMVPSIFRILSTKEEELLNYDCEMWLSNHANVFFPYSLRELESYEDYVAFNDIYDTVKSMDDIGYIIELVIKYELLLCMDVIKEFLFKENIQISSECITEIGLRDESDEYSWEEFGEHGPVPNNHIIRRVTDKSAVLSSLREKFLLLPTDEIKRAIIEFCYESAHKREEFKHVMGLLF